MCVTVLAVAALLLAAWIGGSPAPGRAPASATSAQVSRPSGVEVAERSPSPPPQASRRQATEAHTSDGGRGVGELGTDAELIEGPEVEGQATGEVDVGPRIRCSGRSESLHQCVAPTGENPAAEGAGDPSAEVDGDQGNDEICAPSTDPGAEQDAPCAPHTVHVEAVAGVDPVTGTLTVECRPGFVRGVTSFGALDATSSVSVTRTEATPTSYTVDYTMVNDRSGGMYLQTECVGAPQDDKLEVDEAPRGAPAQE